MKCVTMFAVAVGAMLASAQPATATILWQQAFVADPGGVTSVSSPWMSTYDGTFASPLYLVVDRGNSGATFGSADRQWGDYSYAYWWAYLPEYDAWYLDYDGAFDQGSIVTRDYPNISVFTYVPRPDYDDCNGLYYHVADVICRSEFVFATAKVDASVNATRDFKLALVTDLADVPEPDAWTLMIAGFALVGSAARRRTRAPRTT